MKLFSALPTNLGDPKSISTLPPPRPLLSYALTYKSEKTVRTTGTSLTQAEKANGVIAEVEGCIPKVQIAASRAGSEDNQSRAARLGELLQRWELKQVLLLHSTLGGTEDSATFDACPKSSWLRLEVVE